jgi:hypothetical protein
MEKIKHALGRLEESMGAHEMRVRVRITFVSPTDGSRSVPMTLEEFAQRHREHPKGATNGK